MTVTETIPRVFYSKLLSVLFSLFVLIMCGCGTTKSVVQKITQSKPDLKKRVMVLPFIDQAGVGPERAAQITFNFVELLRKSPNLLLCQPPKGLSLPPGAKTPEFGIVTHPGLIKTAEGLGMNVLITGVLNPIETTTKKTGVWPFRKAKINHEISMVLNVVNVASGCLYLSRHESGEVALPVDEVQGRDEEEITDQVLKKSIPRILKRQAMAVAKNLTQQPWTGKILAVDNNTIRIPAGKDLGVYPGQLFIVLAQGESILGRTGRSIGLLGKKIGKIKVTSVMETQSLAMPVVEAAFLPGQIIRFRP